MNPLPRKEFAHRSTTLSRSSFFGGDNLHMRKLLAEIGLLFTGGSLAQEAMSWYNPSPSEALKGIVLGIHIILVGIVIMLTALIFNDKK